jgi:hypothetical protein
VGAIEREAAGGNDAMDMRVNVELLTPGVQHTEETNFRAEVFRIASDFEKCFRAGAKQEIVEDLLVLQDQWRQPVGQCEDDMEVACREKFSSTRSDPPFPSTRLTLGAVAISARIKRDGAMPAAGALIEMTAEGGGTAPPNGQQHFDMHPPEPLAVSFDEGISRSADDIGHLEGWPVHLLFLR